MAIFSSLRQVIFPLLRVKSQVALFFRVAGDSLWLVLLSNLRQLQGSTNFYTATFPVCVQ